MDRAVDTFASETTERAGARRMDTFMNGKAVEVHGLPVEYYRTETILGRLLKDVPSIRWHIFSHHVVGLHEPSGEVFAISIDGSSHREYTQDGTRYINSFTATGTQLTDTVDALRSWVGMFGEKERDEWVKHANAAEGNLVAADAADDGPISCDGDELRRRFSEVTQRIDYVDRESRDRFEKLRHDIHMLSDRIDELAPPKTTGAADSKTWIEVLVEKDRQCDHIVKAIGNRKIEFGFRGSPVTVRVVDGLLEFDTSGKGFAHTLLVASLAAPYDDEHDEDLSAMEDLSAIIRHA